MGCPGKKKKLMHINSSSFATKLIFQDLLKITFYDPYFPTYTA
jgi:hypothetical protein